MAEQGSDRIGNAGDSVGRTDRAARHYHPVRYDIAGLIAVLAVDDEAVSAFVERHPQTDGWLPLDIALLQAISLTEIVFRLRLNVVCER